MKIVLLCDKNGSAIWRLADSVKKRNPHLNIQLLALHPKRPDVEQITAITEALKDADILHTCYWKSYEKLKEVVPATQLNKLPKILWHHNPYNIGEKNWQEEHDIITCHNSEIKNMIPCAEMIHQGIDMDFWKFNEEYTKDKTVLMVAARIESKKGIREVAQACKDLKYKFILVGRISKMPYFKEIMKVNPDTDFRENVTEGMLREAYHESAIHVCNSIDNFESGTMPILEAMASGVPVLTRNIGHVPDLYSDKTNMVVRIGQPEDMEDLKEELKDLMENVALREKIRGNAWDTIKNWNDIRMARNYEKLYYKVIKRGDSSPFVSVIMPVKERPEIAMQALAANVKQDYPFYEVIVSDSGDVNLTSVIEKIRKQTSIPIKYIRFSGKDEYTLAKARNLAVVESSGEILCFSDERIAMEPSAIREFVKHHGHGRWLFGNKDGAEKKSFVENFSMVSRSMLIFGGMFNERIDCYGGASQELRERFKEQTEFIYVHTAKAKTLTRSRARAGRRQQIIRAKNIVFKLFGST